jgi:hypothetical protein
MAAKDWSAKNEKKTNREWTRLRKAYGAASYGSVVNFQNDPAAAGRGRDPSRLMGMRWSRTRPTTRTNFTEDHKGHKERTS